MIPGEGLNPETWYTAPHDTDPRVIALFAERKQYIGQLELYYACTPYFSLPDRFKGRQVIHFIDNTAACAGMVKGYSSAIDSGKIVSAFHAFNLALGCDVFFEYVRSEANIADLPSRAAFAELADVLWTVDATQVHNVCCHTPRVSAWDLNPGYWMGCGRHAAEYWGRPQDPFVPPEEVSPGTA